MNGGTASLREPFDAAARNVHLAERLAAHLPSRPRLIDMTPRTGDMFRWLAPRLQRAQVWTFVDPNADVLDQAFEACGIWAVEAGYTATFPGHARNRVLLVHTPSGAWRVEAFVLNASFAGHADAILCTAPPADMLRWLGAHVRAPLLAMLIADGRDSFRPRQALDLVLRDTDRLGATALARTLVARGFSVRTAPSDWNVPRTALAMLRAIVEERAALRRGSAATAWRRSRIQQALAGTLAIRVGHRDILALPHGEE